MSTICQRSDDTKRAQLVGVGEPHVCTHVDVEQGDPIQVDSVLKPNSCTPPAAEHPSRRFRARGAEYAVFHVLGSKTAITSRCSDALWKAFGKCIGQSPDPKTQQNEVWHTHEGVPSPLLHPVAARKHHKENAAQPIVSTISRGMAPFVE